MPIVVGVTIYNGQAEPVSKFDASFEDVEWDVLQRFVRYEQELASAVFVRAGMPHDGSFTFSARGEFSSPPLPPDHEIREFLHLLRPFLLESEDTHYPKVQGMLGRQLVHEGIRARLGFLNEFFNCRLENRFMRVNVEDLTINSDATLSLWLNAFEYHRDSEKQQRLAKVTQLLPLPIVKAFMIDMLVMKAEAIQGLAALVRDLIAAVERRRGWVG